MLQPLDPNPTSSPTLEPPSTRTLSKTITKVFEDLDVPKEAVHIIIYETQKTNWATSGKLHPEKPPKHPHYNP